MDDFPRHMRFELSLVNCSALEHCGPIPDPSRFRINFARCAPDCQRINMRIVRVYLPAASPPPGRSWLNPSMHFIMALWSRLNRAWASQFVLMIASLGME